MTLAPVVRELRVAVDPATAYAVFTAHLGGWWPLGGFSVHGATSSVAFEGDAVVERAADGQVSVWAEVLERREPELLRLAWHPGAGPDRATEVEVTFSPDDEGTLVRLVHSGWERLADPQSGRDSYAGGWVAVLLPFGRHLGIPPDHEDTRWFALQHLPGRLAPSDGPLMQHPLFAEHVAFLGRLAADGLLVAAGPLTDEAGAGMTVIRVRPEDGDVDVERLATQDDRSVAGGLLTVRVRPWRVQLSAL
ncbi:SRPBCC domain-containing protein [Angustibacter luteus]|uniref:SRPBCC domain-containing protein n=1 Tax=Angustibacter luteus TaxID=658456 RepID=A0ABW1JC56_9ACTN